MTYIAKLLQTQPWDVRRKLPIPAAHMFEDGTWDYTVLNGRLANKLAAARRCGSCGEEMGYYVAFLGGHVAASTRTYTDPPMHPECAEVSVWLCPYIARNDMQRAPEGVTPRSPHGDEAITPDFLDMSHPTLWGLLTTRKYEIKYELQDDGIIAVFKPAHAVEIRWYDYDDNGMIKERGAGER